MAKIMLIVTGGIRAAKQWDVANRLRDDGHQVRCAVTGSALLFLIPYYLKRPWKILSFFRIWRPPILEMLGYLMHRVVKVSHISTAKWADLVVVAPATANSISKLVSGITDNFAMLIIRATDRNKNIVVAPSMNPEMWFDPFIQKNIDRLNQTRKYVVVAPRTGKMKSGDVGASAMASVDAIVREVNHCLKSKPHAGLTVFAADQNNDQSRLKGETKTIMIVDPNVVFVSRLADLVEKEYRFVQLASLKNADEAIDKAKEINPSVIITEIDLPGNTSGNDFIHSLKNHPDLKSIPIIAISSQERDQIHSETLAQKGIQYIPKPLKPRFLLQTAMGQLSVSLDVFL